MDFLLEDFSTEATEDLLSGLGSSLFATAAALLHRLALALILLAEAELILEEFGEQEVTTYYGGCHTDHDADDDEGGILLFFLLVEAEHNEHPPCG